MAVRPLPRKLSRPHGLPPKPPTPQDATRAVERSHAKHIYELPPDQREIVIDAIRDGVPLANIAAFFGDQGWLRVTEKSFVQYIFAFKRLYPELIVDGDPTNAEEANYRKNLNGAVSKRKPALDEENSLEQLVRVQSLRLRTQLDFEQTSGLPLPNMHKDILATKELLESLATLRGKGGQAKQGGRNTAPISNEAHEQLRKVEASEASADKLTTLVDRLGGLTKKTVDAQTS